MKKILFSATVATLLLPMAVFAQGGIQPVSPLDKTTNIKGILTTITNYALGVLVVIAVLMIVYAAFLYLFASSDEGYTEKAKNIIKWAAIAIAIGLLARAIVYVVGLLIGGTNLDV